VDHYTTKVAFFLTAIEASSTISEVDKKLLLILLLLPPILIVVLVSNRSWIQEHLEDPPINDVSKDCISWHDGCNKCIKKEGEEVICTLRECFPEERDLSKVGCYEYKKSSVVFRCTSDNQCIIIPTGSCCSFVAVNSKYQNKVHPVPMMCTQNCPVRAVCHEGSCEARFI